MPEDKLVCSHCRVPFARPHRLGRLPSYCSVACRSEAHRTPAASSAAADVSSRIGKSVQTKTRALARAAAGPSYESALTKLARCRSIQQDLSDLMTTLSRQALYQERASLDDIARALGLSADEVRAGMEATKATARRQRPESARSQRDADCVPAQHRLGRALSHLQRRDGRSVRALARALDISPSYLSLILLGQRIPPWDRIARIVQACGGRPDDLHGLWERARGLQFADKTRDQYQQSLQAMLRGLHVAACETDLKELTAASPLLRARQVRAMLHGAPNGPALAEWPAVSALARALHADVYEVRRLWCGAFDT
ncbi:helix-turn-helix transcriptional regulator [Streptomyces sp. NPDC005732]|uniref:helix-turn-helix domain-containing protein n=1 Tax=Streptomyces sp. NPDC005732 TaxID=3157057 RepID=UPI00340C2C3F